MALLTSCWSIDIALLIAALLTWTYLKLSKTYKYWKKIGVPTPEPDGFPLGHFPLSREIPVTIIQNEICQRMKDEDYFGVYVLGKKILFVKGHELVKTILVKDFNFFQDRGFDVDAEIEPLNGNLSFMKGHAWKSLRSKLTPTFTSGKMRMMFPTLLEVGNHLTDVFEVGSKQSELEVKDILARYTTDVISSVAFGIETNSLKNPDAIFRKMGRAITQRSFSQYMANFVLFVFPKASRYLPIRSIPQYISDFFIGLVRDTMELRQKNNIQRKDFLQLLLQLRTVGFINDTDASLTDDDPKNKQKFTLEQAAAQAFIFFVGGFETSSTTLQFALYELAVNPEIQAQVQDEIDEIKAKYGGNVTYEAMQEMELLDRVISEVLRRYPISVLLVREATADYNIPNTSIILEKGTAVWVPVFGIQNDPESFPNPEKFDPDRFLPEEKAKRHPFAYLPFGEGPRSCIGNRFALMQIKVGLIVLLSQFTISPSKKTPIPIQLDPKSEIVAPKGPLYFKISCRT